MYSGGQKLNTNRIFAGCFNFFRKWKVKKNQITLIEKLNTGGTGSLFEIKNECEKRGLPFHFNIITHADYEVSPRNLGGLIKLFTVKAFKMATSSHIFLNDNFLPLGYMKLSDETKVVQLWHGMGSFKKFGGSSETDPAVLKELKAATKNTDHILASSKNIRDNYAEAFMAPKEKVICIGCPQVDYFFREHDIDAWKAELCEKYPEMKRKKLVLYAPTFRGDEERDKKLLDSFDFDAFQKELGEEYFLMVRLHPQIQSAKVPDTVANMTDYPNVRKLLCMTDILIADYSSIAVEYSLLNRPIILYAFDKEWYLSEDRGFYFDYEKTAPGPIVENMQDLIDCIENKRWDIAKVEKFAHLHNDYFDDKSAKRVVDYYFGNGKKLPNSASEPEPFYEEWNQYRPKHRRKKNPDSISQNIFDNASGKSQNGKLPEKWATQDAEEAVNSWESERKKQRKKQQQRAKMQEKLKQQEANIAKRNKKNIQNKNQQELETQSKKESQGKQQNSNKNKKFISDVDKSKEKDINSKKQLESQNQKEKNTKETIEEIKSRKEHTMKVIVGLGNPTDQYKGTRHNVGFMAIDRIAEANHININQHKFKAMVGSGFIGGSKVLLVKPLTYMNLSGESLRPIMDFYKVDLSDILVIYDDISLEPGMLRLRTKGSAGGHNGMKSIIKHLGGDTFPRIRVGIGGEKHPGQDLADYVLGHFKDDEKELLSDALDKAEKAAELFAQDEFAEAMNKYSVGKKKRKTLE